MLRLAPALAIIVLIGPIVMGLLATLLPAFGYFPALGGNELSLAPFRELLAQPGLIFSSLISLFSGLVTTLISLAIVLLFFAGWSGTLLFQRIQNFISPLLSIPHAAAAFGLAFLIAPSGWIMRILSPEITGFARPPDWQIVNDPLGMAMIAGLVLKEVPFLFLVCLAAMPQVRPAENLKIARSLGYSTMSGFILTIWPNLYKQIRLAVFAVIAYASSVVDVALILGPTNPAPLAVRLIDWMNDPQLTMRFQASAGAVLQLFVTASAIALWMIGERIAALIFSTILQSGRRFPRDGVVRAFSGFMMIFLTTIVVTGLIVLALWSFAGYWNFPEALPRQLSLQTWERQLAQLPQPLMNTLALGIVVTVIAIAIALACLEREARLGETGGSRALTLLYLPLIIPQPAFVFGIQMLFLWFGISTSFAALALVHLVFVLPYVFLSVSDPWRAWDQRYGQIGITLGASKNRIFWSIRMPMLTRAILVASAIGFAVSIGQYLPTVLIGAGRWPTITTEAVSLASGGDRRVVGVYAFLQMMLPFFGFLLAALVPAFLFRKRRAMRAAT